MSSAYHPGELSVQERAGVRAVAERSVKGIRDFVPAGAAHFLEEQQMLFIGAVAESKKVWASLLYGPRGFVHTEDENTVRIEARLPEDDPLFSTLAAGTALGTLAIDLETRRRLRLNGDAVVEPDGIYLHVREMFGNCQQYIQLRQLDEVTIETPKAAELSRALSPAQQERIRVADTFFIASAHPEAGADISHRGGRPRFIHVSGAQELLWPDYSGNNMFQTLGNLALNAACGLLFLDFETAATLQLTGTAEVLWDTPQMEEFPGALRLVRLQVQQVIEMQHRFPLRWALRGYSPFNP
jgi:predicted pyridoxine 5'-phosphate oxidase superfamily flavin-nucleotide-binding protein